MREFVANKKSKLSDFVLKNYSEVNYSAFMKLLRKKDIKVNGKRVKDDIYIDNGDKIQVFFVEKQKEIKEIYKDENILIAYKPKKISSEQFFEEVNSIYSTARFIHRLDTNTDGLMVFALNGIAETETLKGFKDRTFKKLYQAEVYGVVQKNQETLQHYLLKDSENSCVKVVDKKVNGALPIVTKYKVLERKENSSILEVELVTGRTHQIRAHLSYVGHFIIGDGKYGIDKINRQFKAKTQRLTAYSLTFYFDKDSPLYYLNNKTFKLS